MSSMTAISWRRGSLLLPDSPREPILPLVTQKSAVRRLSNGDGRSAGGRRYPGDEESLASTGRMVHGIAHDIRHYLAAILANAEIMNDPSISPSYRAEAGQDTRDAIADICNMLDLTLLYSCEGNHIPTSIESLNAIVQHAIRMVRCHPDGKTTEIVFQCALSLRQRVNPVLFLSALYNLILNASQAASRASGPGRVDVSLTQLADTIFVRVEDNGPGVPVSMQRALCAPIQSRDRTRARGLGMAIIDYAARTHGGSVTLEKSTLGKTVFCLAIPSSTLPLPTDEDRDEGR